MNRKAMKKRSKIQAWSLAVERVVNDETAFPQRRETLPVELESVVDIDSENEDFYRDITARALNGEKVSPYRR